MMVDEELAERLGQLEARVPGAQPPAIRGRRRAPSILGGSLVGTMLVFVAATAVVGGALLMSGEPRSAPGVEGPGQPLQGAGLECMSPPEAAAYLTDHGFTNTVWQVERDDAATVHLTTPPAHGYVVPGSISDGVLMMIVDQRASATGTGNCFGAPMP